MAAGFCRTALIIHTARHEHCCPPVISLPAASSATGLHTADNRPSTPTTTTHLQAPSGAELHFRH